MHFVVWLDCKIYINVSKSHPFDMMMIVVIECVRGFLKNEVKGHSDISLGHCQTGSAPYIAVDVPESWSF